MSFNQPNLRIPPFFKHSTLLTFRFPPGNVWSWSRHTLTFAVFTSKEKQTFFLKTVWAVQFSPHTNIYHSNMFLMITNSANRRASGSRSSQQPSLMPFLFCLFRSGVVFVPPVCYSYEDLFALGGVAIAFILKASLFGALTFCPCVLVPLLTRFSGCDPRDENFFGLFLFLQSQYDDIYDARTTCTWSEQQTLFLCLDWRNIINCVRPLICNLSFFPPVKQLFPAKPRKRPSEFLLWCFLEGEKKGFSLFAGD